MIGRACSRGGLKMKLIDVINKLSTARLEYHSSNGSVLNKFVVPYFIDRLDLRNISHSIALVGSRGSGKSTYIQYFSHSTRFDVSKMAVPQSEFECILFYWKPDIAYCQGLKPSWLGEHASRFFSLHASLSLLKEITSCIEKTTFHYPEINLGLEEGKRFWGAINKITQSDISSINELYRWISDYKYEISTRLNPVNVNGLLSIQPNPMMEYLLESLRSDCPIFKDTTFKIFVDEFELLNSEQQKLINTYRKESNLKLNWNVAYKSNAKPINQTNSDQWLQSPDDYREENLDEFIQSDFRVFAAEIFILALQNAGLTCDLKELSPEFLGDRTMVPNRKTSEYKQKVLEVVDKILPTPSVKELSRDCLSKNAIKTRIRNLLISYGLNENLISEFFANPSLSITLLGTHKQKSFDLDLLVNFVQEKLLPDDLKKVKEKINTFEFNTLLSLNLQHTSVQVPVYAGFERFITMTSPNIRHFKELCLGALKYSDEVNTEEDVQNLNELKGVSEIGMHLAAISKSSDLIKEVSSYPPFGNRLSQMVNRIGELFRISQKSSHQTEPERVIFTISYDYAGSDGELEDFIYSALSWRVLVEDDSKRIKDDTQITSKEFQLNPVYSPRFGISYRKKRGITLTLTQFKILINGTSEDFENIRKEYQRKWRADGMEPDSQGVLL